MSQLRSDILSKRKREDAENFEKRYKRIHIAEPIQEYQMDEEEHDEFTFNAFNVSDTELEEEEVSSINKNNIDAFENNNALNSEQWTKLIESWIEMVNAEENYENATEKETYDDFEVGGYIIHSADNILAKWKLFDLF